MKLTSMKITKREKKAREEKYSKPIGAGMGGPEYPYGLTVTLERESLKKLGIDKLPAVGKRMHLEASVEVIATRQSDRNKGETTERSVELQICELALVSGPRSTVEAIEDGVAAADS